MEVDKKEQKSTFRQFQTVTKYLKKYKRYIVLGSISLVND